MTTWTPEGPPKGTPVHQGATFGHKTLAGVRRCPYCGDANPQMVLVHVTDKEMPRSTPGPTSRWAIYRCTGCGGVLLAQGAPGAVNNIPVVSVIPHSRTADAALPPMARTYLAQAYETLHAPDAAAVMAGSAVDAMLKELGYESGSVYARIDQALNDNKITQGMADWAHWVRLGANRPRHADKDKPHVSAEEAQQSVEFAEALGYFLFVLTNRIKVGITEAEKQAAQN